MNKQRYVYYKQETGEITDILSEEKEEGGDYINCTNKDVEDFIMGTESTNNYIIAYNKRSKETVMMKKDNIIRLRKESNDLFKIPYEEETERDLVIVYYADGTLEIILDVSRIAPLYQTDFKKEVIFEKGTTLRIYAIEKKSGKILKELIFNAQEALDMGQLFFDLSTDINPDDVDFFTTKTLQSYCWYKGSTKLLSPIREKIKFEVHKADMKRKRDDFSYHLEMKLSDRKIEITNNITNLKLIRFDKDIEFFIVDKHDPNILYEKFSLSEKQLSKKHIDIYFHANLKGKTIFYNHKYISVLVEE